MILSWCPWHLGDYYVGLLSVFRSWGREQFLEWVYNPTLMIVWGNQVDGQMPVGNCLSKNYHWKDENTAEKLKREHLKGPVVIHNINYTYMISITSTTSKCLCKMISNVGKMSYREQISWIISKIFLLLLVVLVRKEQISLERWDLLKFLGILMLSLASYYDFG